MNLFSILIGLEDNDDLHLGRLLVLFSVFAGRNGHGSINGLTKLAKLDFLLRYPVYMERALKARGASPSDVEVADHERKSVESSMVRFRYGPWDFRYRRFINLLVAKGLAQIDTKGRTIYISLTDAGLDVAKHLSRNEQFQDIAKRSRLLKRHFNLSSTNLMKFIYKTFPEISTLRLGEVIEP
jgi:hypothetical protein